MCIYAGVYAPVIDLAICIIKHRYQTWAATQADPLKRSAAAPSAILSRIQNLNLSISYNHLYL